MLETISVIFNRIFTFTSSVVDTLRPRWHFCPETTSYKCSWGTASTLHLSWLRSGNHTGWKSKWKYMPLDYSILPNSEITLGLAS